MPKVLLDFSQTAISSVAVNAKELKSGDQKNLIKHIILNQILSFRKRFRGELILCCDSSSYWRKKEFPYYKGHRKHEKEDSFLDWKLVFEVLEETKQELKENFPYKVLEIPGAEADDIIACLTKYFDENELVPSGMFEAPDDVIIVSTDLDYTQLQKYKNVQQWSNTKKTFIKSKNPKRDLIEYICGGQTKDNIPNLCTGDDWAKARADNVASSRAKSFMTARLPDFYDKGYDACLNESEQRNFRRNELLIDFDHIPSAVYNSIIKEYLAVEPVINKKKIFDYLQQRRMKLLLSSCTDF